MSALTGPPLKVLIIAINTAMAGSKTFDEKLMCFTPGTSTYDYRISPFWRLKVTKLLPVGVLIVIASVAHVGELWNKSHRVVVEFILSRTVSDM